MQHDIELKMYSRYVDDTNLVIKTKKGGEEVNIQIRNERSMKRLQQIGNSIQRNITVTVDFPSKHENGRMPILDTEQWINNVQVVDVIKPQIMHSHYSKPMASKYVCLKDSTMPHQNKMNIFINDLIRIMWNVSSQCKNDERSGKIQEYLLRLQHSGYNKAERHNIYTMAKKKYSEMKENALKGTCPLYRSKFWKQHERQTQK